MNRLPTGFNPAPAASGWGRLTSIIRRTWTMTIARRELVLGFCIFLGILLAAATGVVAYAAYQMQTARFGDIFDRVVLEQTQTWVVPTLIVITGISIVGFLFSSGFTYFWTSHEMFDQVPEIVIKSLRRRLHVHSFLSNIRVERTTRQIALFRSVCDNAAHAKRWAAIFSGRTVVCGVMQGIGIAQDGGSSIW